MSHVRQPGTDAQLTAGQDEVIDASSDDTAGHDPPMCMAMPCAVECRSLECDTCSGNRQSRETCRQHHILKLLDCTLFQSQAIFPMQRLLCCMRQSSADALHHSYVIVSLHWCNAQVGVVAVCIGFVEGFHGVAGAVHEGEPR